MEIRMGKSIKKTYVFHKEITETLSTLEKPTKETLAEDIHIMDSCSIKKIVPLTGYYALDNKSNGFISIDTIETIVTYCNETWIFHAISVIKYMLTVPHWVKYQMNQFNKE